LPELLRVVGVGHERRECALPEHGHQVRQQPRAQRVLETSRHDADHAAALRDHVARDQVDLIAERTRGGHHAFARVGRDARRRRERARHRGARHAGARRRPTP
jgi:hypothetical protein